MTKSQGEIIYDIKNLIVEYKEKDHIKTRSKNNRVLRCQFRCPTPGYGKKKETIKRYLKILQLFYKKGLKGMAAYERIPIEIVPSEYELPDMYNDLSKAQKILKNVEKGFFPGKYT